MAFYYQHVGEAMAARDFPKSIGTSIDGPHNFSAGELASRFGLDRHISERDFNYLNESERRFQVWGFPRGAEKTLKDIRPADTLMLMGSKIFDYIGQIEYRVPRFSDALSTAIWGEARFPIVVLMSGGQFIGLPFDTFAAKLGFAAKYHMRGNTMKVGPQRLRAAGFSNSDEFAAWCKAQRST